MSLTLFINKRVFNLTPKGILPIIKDNDTVIIGIDKIIPYLEKNYKLSKLAVKKKIHAMPLNHCTTILEPLVSKIIENLNTAEKSLQALLIELTTIDNNIKGPFYLGAQLSWVCEKIFQVH